MAYVNWNEKDNGFERQEYYVTLEDGQSVDEALAEIDTSQIARGSLAFVSGHGTYSWNGTTWDKE